MPGERRKPAERSFSGERGQALVLFSLALAVFMGLVALSVDVGLIWHQRADLQKTADAAALAGTIELPQSAVLAEDKAQEWAERNGIDLAEGDEITITVSPDQTSVTVEVRREQPFFFARVLGFESVDVSASATARVGAPYTLSGFLPFGVLESAVNYDGTPTTLKYDASTASSSGGPTTGNFGPLAVDGSGSSILQDSIKDGTTNSLCGTSQPSCQDPTSETQTGNVVSAARNGFNYLFSQTSQSCDEFSEVLIPKGDGSYNVNGSCNPFTGATASYRLVLVPVIEVFPTGSSTTVTIKYFTAVFLGDFVNGNCTGNSCEVTATFVKVVVDPTNDATLGIYDEDSAVKFVRLVE